MKLYAVTQGDYSDYCILGLFSDKEKAERCAVLTAPKWGLGAVVKEYEADAFDDPHPGLLPYEIRIGRHGATHAWLRVPEVPNKHLWRPPCSHDKDQERIHIFTWARDEAHAVKIAGDIRRQLIASGEWTLNEAAWRKVCRIRLGPIADLSESRLEPLGAPLPPPPRIVITHSS